MKLAIKIDADNLRPALVGVPRLAEVLETQSAGASFLFSVGPDRSGRHIGRMFRSGMPRRLWRTRRIRNSGVSSLLYGTVLPAPDIGSRASTVMRAIRDSGFETGVRAFDHLEWSERAAHQDQDWISQQMTRARSRFEDILGEAPRVHGAAGWQMNRYAYRFTQRLDFAYSSDTRGTHPFIPVCQAEVISCPQLPTTLPTMDELVAAHGLSKEGVVARLLELTEEPAPWGHVFSGNAAFEGLELLSQFEQLLRGWRHQGYDVVSLHDYMVSIDTQELPYHEVVSGFVPGRPGSVAMQGKEFLA